MLYNIYIYILYIYYIYIYIYIIYILYISLPEIDITECYIRVYIFNQFVHVFIGISTMTGKMSRVLSKIGPLL